MTGHVAQSNLLENNMLKHTRVIGLFLAFAIPFGFATPATAASPICNQVSNYLDSNDRPWHDSIGNTVYWGIESWFRRNC